MEEEINLRDLIEVIINGKWIIIGICFIAILFAGVFSFFVLPEKYKVTADIVFDKQIIEKYGLPLESYAELITNHSRIEYVYNHLELKEKEYSLKSLKDSIEMDINKDANQITITVTGTDAEALQQIVNLLGQNSVNEFNKRLIKDREFEIVKTEKIIDNINKELEGTPKLLDISEIKNQGGQVIVIPEVNPLYENLSTRWDQINNSLIHLKAEKENLEIRLQADGQGVYIMLHKAPIPEEPVGPRKMLNMAVAGVLGMMVSVFLVFFMEFWRKSEPQQGIKSTNI